MDYRHESGGTVQPVGRPDLVLVVVDDWALSDLEAARTDGNPWNDLPAIDSFAALGQSWTNFYSQPICNPTRLTLMLGAYESGDGGGVCNPPNASTPSARVTLASLLHDQGYATAAFGKWHIATNPDSSLDWTTAPAAYGFDAWRAWNASNLSGHCGSKDYSNWERIDDGVAFQSFEYHTEAVGLAFLDWWRATAGPRFAYVCFQAPHQPLHTPPAHLLPSGYPAPTSNREEYEAMLVALDTLLATMLAGIDLRDTYVFVVGDNGTPPAAVRPDQSSARVKTTTYEDGVNVPFLVAGPGIPIGSTDALGHVVDFPATLVALAGGPVPIPAMPDSVSLVPILRDPAQRVRDHVICDVEIEASIVPNTTRDTCVVLDSADGLLKGRFYEDRLRMSLTKTYFALGVDPAENAPLSAQDPVFADEIESVLQLWTDYRQR